MCRAAKKRSNVRKSGENKRPKHIGLFKDAEDKKECFFHDLGSVQKIQTRSQVRVGFWAIHLESPSAALAKASEFTEQCGKAAVVTSAL